MTKVCVCVCVCASTLVCVHVCVVGGGRRRERNGNRKAGSERSEGNVLITALVAGTGRGIIS